MNKFPICKILLRKFYAGGKWGGEVAAGTYGCAPLNAALAIG